MLHRKQAEKIFLEALREIRYSFKKGSVAEKVWEPLA